MKRLCLCLLILGCLMVGGCSDSDTPVKAMKAVSDLCEDGDVLLTSVTVNTWGSSVTIKCKHYVHKDVHKDVQI